MTVSAATTGNAIPRKIAFPLYWGGACVCGFIAVVAIWAVFAPLATTVHVQGHLTADTPGFDLQHPYGGALAEVLVQEHERVDAGQILARLDVSREKEEVEILGELLALRQAELEIIEHILAQDLEAPLEPGGYAALRPFQRLATRHQLILLEQEAMYTEKHALQARIEDLAEGVNALRGRHRSMKSRYQSYKLLVSQGTMRVRDHELLNEQIYELENDIAAGEASISALQAELERAGMNARRGLIDFRQQLLSDHIQTTMLLPELKTQFAKLNARLNLAEVRAPSDGVVSSLHYNREKMYLPTGRTFLTLTEPLSKFQVEFQVPPSTIDQVQVGMVGTISFNGLPQRNLPKVQLRVQSLSPVATRSSDGEVVSYLGKATIDRDDFDALKAQLGVNYSLSIDMPVSVSFVGRQTTFFDYLAGPFFTFLEKAWQD